MIKGTIVHKHDELGPFVYIEQHYPEVWNMSQYTYEYAIGELPPHYPVPAIPLKVTWFKNKNVIGLWIHPA